MRMHAPSRFLPAALAAGLLLAGAACGRKSQAPDAGPPTPSTRTPWVKARPAEGVPLLEAPASVLPSPEGLAAVVPPYRARVLKVLVQPGLKVKKGQRLVEVVMPEVSTAAGAYASASTRVDAYGRRKAQLEALKTEGLVRLADVLEAETKLAEARADQQSAAAALRTAQVDPAEAQDIVSGKVPVALRSPIDGVVTAVSAAIGDTREPSGEPVARVAGEGDSRVEARFARAFEPQHAAFAMHASNGVTYPMRFVARAPNLDPRDGTIAFWFVNEDGARLPPGLTGRMVVSLRGIPDTAVVPARAVALVEGRAHVVVHRGDRSERVGVAVIASSGAEALVKGLEPETEVAADAALAEAPAAEGAPGK